MQNWQKLVGHVIGEHIQIETSFDPDVPHIYADPDQIGQALTNLLQNAADSIAMVAAQDAPDGWHGTIWLDVDGKRIVTSDQAIALDKVPGRLLVIGAGVIGLELGSVWRRLGSKVTVVEFLDRILPGMDMEVARQSQRLLEKQGMTFKLASKVTGVDSSGATLKASIEPSKGGASEIIEADVILVATGRTPYTEGLGLKDAGVALDERGRSG